MLWIDHGLVGDEINLDEVREQGKQNFWRKSIWRSRDSRCKGPEAEWSSSEEAAKTGTYKTLVPKFDLNKLENVHDFRIFMEEPLKWGNTRKTRIEKL
jgi:hypothetical protein